MASISEVTGGFLKRYTNGIDTITATTTKMTHFQRYLIGRSFASKNQIQAIILEMIVITQPTFSLGLNDTLCRRTKALYNNIIEAANRNAYGGICKKNIISFLGT
jgi:hypothetical protein